MNKRKLKNIIEEEILKVKKESDGLVIKTKSEKDTLKAIDLLCSTNKLSGYIDGLFFVYKILKMEETNDCQTNNKNN